ncbi:hypothetical protein QBC40DRAFT_49562 [Triangularia verruculosa]|uniref:Nascent polypeptide-associated complex subunit alpha-like UBA domain-containing protein n=1 Tax=Triangularia verruculosa TaxID=2587418 RepID=A0AAN7B0D1_9PEZI|nr:hypothetical protein QBC40DRAFT_49562 [Triangularia verruculosa]
MAEPQPPIHEGATDDIETTTKPSSAEDRKAAAALSNLDSSADNAGDSAQVDQAAATNALNSVSEKKKTPAEAPAKSKVKVNAADIALLVAELEVTKARATELLKQHEGDAVKTIRAFVQPAF